jgi:mRNA interferase MazF
MVKLDPNTTNSLSKPSAADCFQIRSVSKTRFVKKIGLLSADEMEEIEQALSAVLHS